MPKYRKKSVPAWGAPLQAVWQKASVPVLAALYFLLVCLSSSSTVKPAALWLVEEAPVAGRAGTPAGGSKRARNA